MVGDVVGGVLLCCTFSLFLGVFIQAWGSAVEVKILWCVDVEKN